MADKLSEKMLSVAHEASQDDLWRPLASYYELRAQGRRDDANQAAERFAASARLWPFEERKRFGLWFMNRTGDLLGRSRLKSRYIIAGSGLFAPQVVVEAVLWPTLAEWAQQEPDNPEPWFWRGLYEEGGWDHIGRALRLHPTYGPACAAKIEMILTAVEYDQHELPSGYLNDLTEDLSSLSEAERLAAHVDGPAYRQELEQRIGLRRAIAEDWIRLGAGLKGTDWATRSAIWQDRRGPGP